MKTLIAVKITEKLPRLHHHKDFKSLVQTPQFRPRKAFNMTVTNTHRLEQNVSKKGNKILPGLL